MLESLRQEGLTAKVELPKVVREGLKGVWYLRYHLGCWWVHQQVDQMAVIVACLCPKSKKGGEADVWSSGLRSAS